MSFFLQLMMNQRKSVGSFLILVTSAVGMCVVLPTSSSSPSSFHQSSSPVPTHLPSPKDLTGCWDEVEEDLSASLNSTFHVMCPLGCGEVVVVVEGVWLMVTGGGDSDEVMRCLRQQPWTQGRLLQDVYWFTSREAAVIYLGNTSEEVLTWDYLTKVQKAVEVMFLAVMVVGVVAALLGNSLVLVTMLTSEKSDALWVMRAALAVCDLLRAATVMPLAIHDTVSLMTHPGELLDMDTSHGTYARGGTLTFVGVMFWVTSMASIQSLAWLSVERVVLCGFPHHHRRLTTLRVQLVVAVLWLLAAGLSIAVLLRSQGHVTYFDAATKLTFLLPDSGTEAAAHMVLLGVCWYLTGLSLLTAVVSVVAVWTFRVRALKEGVDEKRHTPISYIRRREKDDQAVQCTLLLMLTTYLLSVPPFLIFLLLQQSFPSISLSSHAQGLRSIFTWTFIFTSSWQWYVYNLRSDFFRRQVARLLLSCVILPEGLKKRLRNTAASDHAPSLDWGHAWYEMHAFIRKKSTVVQIAKDVDSVGVVTCVVDKA